MSQEINSIGKLYKKHFQMHKVPKFCLLIIRTIENNNNNKKSSLKNESIVLFSVLKGEKPWRQSGLHSVREKGTSRHKTKIQTLVIHV